MNYGFIELIGELTKKITSKLFYLPGEASFVIIGSMISGFPSSAKYIKELLENKNITKDEAELKEIELIKKYNANKRQFGYNIESGGSLNKEISEETRLKLI